VYRLQSTRRELLLVCSVNRTSPPSSKTNTSPCSNGDMVPASVLRYGSAGKEVQISYPKYPTEKLLNGINSVRVRKKKWHLDHRTEKKSNFKSKENNQMNPVINKQTDKHNTF